MRPIERGPERDAALLAALPDIAFDGWGLEALRRAGVPDPDLLFPGGAAEMVEAWCDLTDRRMAELARPEGGLTSRVRGLVAWRLADAEPHKEAVRRAITMMAMPFHARMAARCTARSVDAIWHAAGDRSADASWYSKRALLAAIFSATLLFWLRDASDGAAETLAFLDRRLADIGRIARLRGRFFGPRAA
jgi:ubiquinone biosynthesis protein COQ9